MFVEYSSNNSGGNWWLKDKDWKALEAAGWKVEWSGLGCQYNEDGNWIIGDDGMPEIVEWQKVNSKYPFAGRPDADGRYMGDLAKRAYLKCDTLREAVESFEKATGQDASAMGCPCCGHPHQFSKHDQTGRCVAWLETETSMSTSYGDE